MRRDPFAWRRVATIAPEPDPLLVFLDVVAGMVMVSALVRNAPAFSAQLERIVEPLRWLIDDVT